MKNKFKKIQIIVLNLAFGFSACKRPGSLEHATLVTPLEPQTENRMSETYADVTREIDQGETFTDVLIAEGLSMSESQSVITAAKKIVDLRRIKTHSKVGFYYPDGQCCRAENIEKITLQLPEAKALVVNRQAPGQATAQATAQAQVSSSNDSTKHSGSNSWVATLVSLPIETRLVKFSTTLSSPSLWQSADEAGIDLTALSLFTELFSWDIDFSREVKKGASLSFLIQEKIVDGRRLEWGPIMAASFFTGERLAQAVYFEGNENRKGGYYRPDGQSLKRLFLKAPIETARITSGFSFARFHPILKDSRPHLGVDYAAPTGTPIRTIGDGIVLESRFREGSGNFIRIRHNGVYETAYKHLSRFSTTAAPGSSVQQGEVIGYVGSTGWATGPHLHFELYRKGQYVDPLTEDFPSADPLTGSDLALFLPQAKIWLNRLSAEDSRLLVNR